MVPALCLANMLAQRPTTVKDKVSDAVKLGATTASHTQPIIYKHCIVCLQCLQGNQQAHQARLCIRGQGDHQQGNPKEHHTARSKREGGRKLPGFRAKRKKLRERFQPPLDILLVSDEKDENRGTLDPVSNPIIANAQAMGSYALALEFLTALRLWKAGSHKSLTEERMTSWV